MNVYVWSYYKEHIQHTMFFGIWVVGRGELFIVLHVNFCVKTLHFSLDFKDSLLASSRPLGSGQTRAQQKKMEGNVGVKSSRVKIISFCVPPFLRPPFDRTRLGLGAKIDPKNRPSSKLKVPMFS